MFVNVIKVLLVSVFTFTLVGCGYFDRKIAAITGNGADICHDGVMYVQFTSGVSVKYNTNGTIVTCK